MEKTKGAAKDPIFVRNPFNYDMHQASKESGLLCKDESLTKQSFAEECDINVIVERFNLTGQLPENVRMPTYADFEGVFDFHTAMNAVAKAHEAFDQMPAEVRLRFNNDPGDFVAFCSDDSNRAEAEKLGLVAPRKASEEAHAMGAPKMEPTAEPAPKNAPAASTEATDPPRKGGKA